MKPQTLFENKQFIDSATAKLEKAQDELNALNDFLSDHKLGPLTLDLALKFTKNPTEALRGLYKEKIPALNEFTGLQNDKDAMISQMKLPEAPRADSFTWVGLAEDSLHVFDFGKTVSINPDRLQEHLNRWRYITSDPAQIEAFEDFKALAKQLDKINDKLNFIQLAPGNSPNLDYRLGEVLAFTSRGFEVQKTGFLYAVGKIRK